MERDGRANEQLIFTFNGENNVDIDLLVNALNGISESYKNMIFSKCPEAGVELKIEAFNKGSFEVIISSAVSMAPIIIPVTQTALSNVKLFLDIIKLKKDLKGKKPSKINTKGDKAEVINQNGETHYHNCEVTNIYMNNPLIDKGLTDLFSSLRDSKSRKAISIKSYDERVIIAEKEYENMSVNLVENSVDIESRHIKNQVRTNLLLKKPDLLGESKWQFQYEGKTISAAIEDKLFLKKVKSGEIKALYAHVRIPVEMMIEVFMNEKLEIVNKKHTILKVVGDVIEPEAFEQMKLT